MENLKNVSTGKLQDLVADTESTLSELKTELEKRQESAQHREIDNLEEHLANAELSLKSIKDFFAYLVADMRRDEGK